jgi:hypothetical protein
VLVLTGHARAEYITTAIDAGAWGYLSKAEDSRVIVDSIRRVAAGAFVLGKYTQLHYARKDTAGAGGSSMEDPADGRRAGGGAADESAETGTKGWKLLGYLRRKLGGVIGTKTRA